MRNKLVALYATVTTAILLRLAPVLVSGTIFSLDTWPLIRDAQMAAYKEVPIYSDNVLSGYHNHWPGIILESIALSKLLGLPLSNIYSTYMVLVIATALVIASILITSSRSMGAAAIVLFPSLLIYTSAPLKEAYSLPLLILSLHLILNRSDSSRGWLIVLTLLVIGIAVGHNLAGYMLLGSTVSLLFYHGILRFKDPLYNVVIPKGVIRGLILTLIIIPTYNMLQYSALVRLGLAGMSMGRSLVDLGVIFPVFYLGLFLIRSGRALKIFAAALAVSGLILLSLTGNTISVVPGLYYSMDMNAVLIGLDILLGFVFVAAVRPGTVHSVYSRSALLFISSNIAYIVLMNPLLTGILHRFLNYIGILVGVSVAGIRRATGSLQGLLALYIVVSIAGSSLLTYSTITISTPLTYHWLYTEGEVRGLDIIDSYIPRGFIVVGDDKIAYYYTDLRKTDPQGIIGMLKAGSLGDNEIFILYAENYRFGFIYNTNIIPPNNLDAALDKLDKVYSGGRIEAYTG